MKAQTTRPISAIGPTEHLRRGWKVQGQYDSMNDEFVLTATTGKGRVLVLDCWTDLYRETPRVAKRELLRTGASVVVNTLDLLEG